MFARCLLLPFLALLATAFFSGNCRLVAAQEAEATEQPQPVTTLDAEIPLDHLELFVKPLTKDELAIEARVVKILSRTEKPGITYCNRLIPG